MKSTILISVLCGATAGVAGSYLATPTAQTAAPTDIRKPKQTVDMTALTDAKAQIRALQKQVDGLESKLRAGLKRPVQPPTAKVKPTPASDGVSAPTPADRTAPKPQFEGLDRWMGDAIRTDTSPVRAAVLEMVQDEMKNRGAEWRTYYRARREARDERKLNELAEKVELSDGQRDGLLQLLSAEREQIWSARREARKTLDFGSLRDTVESMRKETNEKVADLLKPEQIDGWNQMREDMEKRRR
ncbi:MAG: hypothetical protein VX589_20830 [Myxococcota bacterium]|nr:hypothetical protein [Myxococcota bacterium]